MTGFTDKEDIAVRRLMDKYHVALSVLAQGDASPFMTDQFRAELEGAREKLAKYRIKTTSGDMPDAAKSVD